MSVLQTALLYGGTLASFLVLDLLWLGVVARRFYAEQLGTLLRPDVNWAAALLFYVLYVGGIIVLAVIPALARESVGHAIQNGAVLGLVAYAAYDLTNLATLQGFPRNVVAVDMVWGTLLTGAVAAAGYGIGRLLAG